MGNISAVGGGIVFIPEMIFIFQSPPVVALKIALASQSMGMTSGAIGWIQKKVVPLVLLSINSIFLTLLHQFVPHLGGIPWDIAIGDGLLFIYLFLRG